MTTVLKLLTQTVLIFSGFWMINCGGIYRERTIAIVKYNLSLVRALVFYSQNIDAIGFVTLKILPRKKNGAYITCAALSLLLSVQSVL